MCCAWLKKKRELCPTFRSRQRSLSNTLLILLRISQCETRSKSEKWSKTYILSISGSSKAVQGLTNSKLPKEISVSSGKLPADPPFPQDSAGKVLAFLQSVKHRVQNQEAQLHEPHTIAALPRLQHGTRLCESKVVLFNLNAFPMSVL